MLFRSAVTSDGTIYTAETSDADGNTIFSYGEGDNKKYIKSVNTYTDTNGKSYTRTDVDGTKLIKDGKEYTATGEKDADGNATYKDADGNVVSIKVNTSYYATTATEEETNYYQITDADGNTYAQDDTLLYVDKSGNKYYEENGKLIQTTGEKADDGTWVKSANAKEVSFDADKKAKAKQTVYNQGAELSDVVTGTKAYTSLAESAQKKMSLSDDEMSTYLSTLTTNIGTVNSYENGTDTLGDDSNYTREKVIANIQSAYGTGGSTAVTAEVNKYAQIISDNKTAMTDSQKIMDDNQVLADIAAMENGDEKTKAIESFVSQVKTVQDITTNPSVEYNIDAKKIDGCDSKITLNGIEYIGSSNSFSINGLNITAQVVTGDGDANAISITTATDTQGIYDKIKDFLSQYNSLINEITSLYNADSAKGYEPSDR